MENEFASTGPRELRTYVKCQLLRMLVIDESGVAVKLSWAFAKDVADSEWLAVQFQCVDHARDGASTGERSLTH